MKGGRGRGTIDLVLDVTEALVAMLKGGGRGALATVVRTSGSAPQRPGARMLFGPGEQWVGTVGGGAIEEVVREALRGCQRDRRPQMVVRDLGRDLGMCCGGRMEVFVEPIEGTPRLLICGAGHVARPTAAMALEAGFAVTVADDRAELLTEARFNRCERLQMEPAEAAEAFDPTAEDWIVITTHDHQLDEEALAAFGAKPHRYLGMIGSRRKVFRILQRLQHRGALPPLEHVFAPIGLDIGAVTPAEIGLSIVAELVALRHGTESRHLRAVDDPRVHKVLAGELTAESAALLPY